MRLFAPPDAPPSHCPDSLVDSSVANPNSTTRVDARVVAGAGSDFAHGPGPIVVVVPPGASNGCARVDGLSFSARGKATAMAVEAACLVSSSGDEGDDAEATSLELTSSAVVGAAVASSANRRYPRQTACGARVGPAGAVAVRAGALVDVGPLCDGSRTARAPDDDVLDDDDATRLPPPCARPLGGPAGSAPGRWPRGPGTMWRVVPWTSSLLMVGGFVAVALGLRRWARDRKNELGHSRRSADRRRGRPPLIAPSPAASARPPALDESGGEARADPAPVHEWQREEGRRLVRRRGGD